MSQTEFVVPINKPLRITQEAVFNAHELYSHIRSWVNNNSYLTYEKEYNDKIEKNEEGKSTTIRLETWKKVDDYTKYHLNIKITFKNIKDVETKSGVLNKGKVIIKITSFIETDYENRWETNFMTRFMRSIYDKFFTGERIDEYKSELMDETYELFNEVKSFLGLHKIKT